MAKFKDLITGVINKKALPRNAVKCQRLAAAMAWQILGYSERSKPKDWLRYNKLRGVMLADEVGGGKTFEALAIISKALLESTGRTGGRKRFRVLIIANPSIRSKWCWLSGNQAEEKLSLSFEQFQNREYTPQTDLQKFIIQANTSQNKLFDFFSNQKFIGRKKGWLDLNMKRQEICLTSFNSLPKTKGRGIACVFIQDGRKKQVFPHNSFDWIIVDEAHSLKGGLKDFKGDETLKLDNSAIRKIYAVLNANIGAKVLLLSATPFQNSRSELEHLLSLLEDIKEKNDTETITGLVSQGIAALEKEFQTLAEERITIDKAKELKQKFDNDINALLNLEGDKKVERPRELKKHNDSKNGLDDFLRDLMIRNTKVPLVIQPKYVELGNKEKLQYLLLRNLVKANKDESQMFSTKLSQLVSSSNSFSNSFNDPENYNDIKQLFQGNLVFEAKQNKLIEIIKNIEVTKGKNVITIFVSWLETVKLLEKSLKKSNFHVAHPLTGNIKTHERDKLLKEIAAENEKSDGKIILLASRVGNEGLDFDKFCNRVIHYDNNFNPAVIDQRNGRVYRDSNLKRIGKTVGYDDVKIYQLVLDETYDQRILFIEKEKRKLKNFYLRDGSLQEVLKKTLEKNNLLHQKELIDIIESIRINLTPNKKYLLQRYRADV